MRAGIFLLLRVILPEPAAGVQPTNMRTWLRANCRTSAAGLPVISAIAGETDAASPRR